MMTKKMAILSFYNKIFLHDFSVFVVMNILNLFIVLLKTNLTLPLHLLVG